MLSFVYLKIQFLRMGLDELKYEFESDVFVQADFLTILTE